MEQNVSQRKLLEYFLENVCTLLIEQNPVHRTIIFKPKVDSWLTESDVYFTPKDQSITIGIHGRQRFPFKQHAALPRVTRILRGCYVSVCLHILFGGGLFIILRFGWSSVCAFQEQIQSGISIRSGTYWHFEVCCHHCFPRRCIPGVFTYNQPNVWTYIKSKHWLPSKVASVPFRAYGWERALRAQVSWPVKPEMSYHVKYTTHNSS